MNPMTNRWAALFVVVVFLLFVAELVGSDENGGVLSRAAETQAMGAPDGPPGYRPEVIGPSQDIPVIEDSAPPIIIENGGDEEFADTGDDEAAYEAPDLDPEPDTTYVIEAPSGAEDDGAF